MYEAHIQQISWNLRKFWWVRIRIHLRILFPLISNKNHILTSTATGKFCIDKLRFFPCQTSMKHTWLNFSMSESLCCYQFPNLRKKKLLIFCMEWSLWNIRAITIINKSIINTVNNDFWFSITGDKISFLQCNFTSFVDFDWFVQKHLSRNKLTFARSGNIWRHLSMILVWKF